MHLSTKFEFAFICVPKCASTAIEAAIQPYCNVSLGGHPSLKHMPYHEAQGRIFQYHEKRIKSRLETFCVMRDPLDWICSWYRYRKRTEFSNPKHRDANKSTKEINLKDFIHEYCKTGIRRPFARIRNQSHFICETNGKPGPDFIFSFNNLNMLESFLTEKVGQEIRLTEKNTSPKESIDIADVEKEMLKDKLAEDFRLYHKVNKTGYLKK